MTRPIRFLPAAEREVVEAHDWYEERRPSLGGEFLLALDAVLSRAARNPDHFEVVARRTHRAVLRRFPYLVFFTVEDDGLLVTGLFHGRRDPRRWSGRVREGLLAYGVASQAPAAT